MKNLIWLCLLIIPVLSFSKMEEEENKVNPEKEVLEVFHKMYDTYAKGNSDFFDYYEKDFVRVDGKGNIRKGVEKHIKEWNDFMEKYNLQVTKVDSPEMVIASDQVITINEYEELFIKKEEPDTIFNKGVYIAAWRKQPDDSWKISMDTWHAGLE